jgi:hypothetical protein
MCPPSGNQVDGLPLAPRKDAAAAGWPVFGRGCICKNRRVFLSSGDASDLQERLRNERSLYESKAFSTCPPSGNQVDGLPLAPRKDAASASWPFSVERACVKLDVFLLSSDDVSEVNVLVNLYFSDSYHIEASITASGCSK